MSIKIKETINSSFYQLLVVYTLLVLAISLGFLGKYSLQMSLFALVVAVFGIFAVKENKEKVVNNSKSKQSYNISNVKNEKERLVNDESRAYYNYNSFLLNSKLHYTLLTLSILFITFLTHSLF